MPDELHITSLVVHCRPGHAADIAARIAALSNAEVRGGIAEGKLVVLLETTSEQQIVERLNEIQLLDGVLAATLVFHHFESSDPSQASTGESEPCTSHAAT
jgi:nitrate reductase NapD